MVSKREKYLYIFLIWVVFTFILTSIPRLPVVAGILHVDKVAHFLIYGVSGLLYSSYLREGGLPRELIFLYTFLLIALIGGIDEIHQRWIPRREPSFFDWMADASGGAVGSIMVIISDRVRTFRATTNNE